MKKTRSGKRRTTCPRSPQPMSLPLHDSCPFRCAPGPHAWKHLPHPAWCQWFSNKREIWIPGLRCVYCTSWNYMRSPWVRACGCFSEMADSFGFSKSPVVIKQQKHPPPKIPLRGRAYLLPPTSLASDCFLCSSCLPLASCCHFRDYSPSHFKRHKWRALRGGPALGAWVGRTGSDG